MRTPRSAAERPIARPGSRRIARGFAHCAAAGRKALIPYITAGDPDLDTTLALMHTLVEAGADMIELGVPFSDPMADGPVIQAACERALQGGTRLRDVIDLVARFRQTNDATAIVLMGYMNPVERLGYDTFATLAREAGVDGVLVVDLPPEEADELLECLNDQQLDAIFLLSPTTPDWRVQAVCERVSGYIYYVSLKGITGAGNLDTVAVATKVNHIKSLVDMPVAVGFGIRDAGSAATISATADAVIVGSALVQRVGEHGADADALHASIRELVSDMRQAMDARSAVAASA